MTKVRSEIGSELRRKTEEEVFNNVYFGIIPDIWRNISDVFVHRQKIIEGAI